MLLDILAWRLLRLLPPEASHDVTFFFLDKIEQWNNFRWDVYFWLDRRVRMMRMRDLRRNCPLVA